MLIKLIIQFNKYLIKNQNLQVKMLQANDSQLLLKNSSQKFIKLKLQNNQISRIEYGSKNIQLSQQQQFCISQKKITLKVQNKGNQMKQVKGTIKRQKIEDKNKKPNPQINAFQQYTQIQESQSQINEFIFDPYIQNSFLQQSQVIKHEQKKNVFIPQKKQKTIQQAENITQKAETITQQTGILNQQANDKNYDIRKVINQYVEQKPKKALYIHSMIIDNIRMPSFEYKVDKQMGQNELYQVAKLLFLQFKIEIKEKELIIQRDENSFILYYKNYLLNLKYDNTQLKFGEWKQNQKNQKLLNGYALNIKHDSYIVKGQYANGLLNGKGVIKMSNGDIYDGEWINGQRQGHGKFYNSKNNSIKEGQFKNGRLNGFGLVKQSNQTYYQGTYFQDFRDGYGKQFYQNGTLYQGSYSNGRRHGKGRQSYSNGAQYGYDGQYRDGKRNGFGKQILANGDIYQGMWSNDLKHGQGHIKTFWGQTAGLWQNDKLVKSDSPIDNFFIGIKRIVS